MRGIQSQPTLSKTEGPYDGLTLWMQSAQWARTWRISRTRIARCKFAAGSEAAAPSIMRATTQQEALAALEQRIQGLNPLAGTKYVGKGNCGNEAITQAVTLLTGAKVCAIPYAFEQSFVTKQIADAHAIISGSVGTEYTTAAIMKNVLRLTLPEGKLAMLASRAGDTGHTTLVAKINGELVHINNQITFPGWDKIVPFDTYAKQWATQFPGRKYEYRILTMFDATLP